MKRTLLAISLILCVLICAVSCTDPNSGANGTKEPATTTAEQPVPGSPVTDENGENVTDEQGEVVTNPATPTGTGIENAGANTESGWGPIIR